MREAKRLGCRRRPPYPRKAPRRRLAREILDDIFYIPEDLTLQQMIHAVSYMARTVKIDRIVALDEFDMEPAAELREHMRIPAWAPPRSGTRATSWPCANALTRRESWSRPSVPF